MKKYIFSAFIALTLILSGFTSVQASTSPTVNNAPTSNTPPIVNTNNSTVEHAAGTNFRTSDSSTIWYIYNEVGGPANRKVRRPYTSAAVFHSYSWNNFSKVVVGTAGDMALPIGDVMPPRDGSIMCSNNGELHSTCYLITGGKKAAFTSYEAFTCLGFNFNHAGFMDLSAIPDDKPISSCGDPHRSGVVIKSKSTLQLVNSGSLIGFPTWPIFLSWGYYPDEVVPANSADKVMPQSFVASARVNGQLSVWEQFIE